MGDTRLWELLQGAREEILERAGARKSGPCLSFERVEAVALNPRGWTEEEREHVSRCRTCARLAAVAMRETVHPSVWSLLRHRLGLVTEAERRIVEHHLGEGECLVCNERLQALPRISDLT